MFGLHKIRVLKKTRLVTQETNKGQRRKAPGTYFTEKGIKAINQAQLTGGPSQLGRRMVPRPAAAPGNHRLLVLTPQICWVITSFIILSAMNQSNCAIPQSPVSESLPSTCVCSGQTALLRHCPSLCFIVVGNPSPIKDKFGVGDLKDRT